MNRTRGTPKKEYPSSNLGFWKELQSVLFVRKGARGYCRELVTIRNRHLNLGISLLFLVCGFLVKFCMFSEMSITECLIVFGILQYIWLSYRQGNDVAIMLLTVLTRMLPKE